MIYAGIGSRQTPVNILTKMEKIAGVLAYRGYVLRSGGASGADAAFKCGCSVINGKHEIFTPADVDANPAWVEHAAMFHPTWKKLDRVAQGLHARNSAIMLGRSLNTPVDFVVCWTRDDEPSGGTGQAIRIANTLGIPVFNLFNDPTTGGILHAWLEKRK